MDRVLLVKTCYDCPSYDFDEDRRKGEERACMEKDSKTIEDPFYIPDWCPLPTKIEALFKYGSSTSN
jgi:hypothetical protein